MNKSKFTMLWYYSRWTAVNKMAEAWQKRMAEMVVMWEKQAATADKVSQP